MPSERSLAEMKTSWFTDIQPELVEESLKSEQVERQRNNTIVRFSQYI
jgi:hypothetical protein